MNEIAPEFWQRVKDLIKSQNTTQEWLAKTTEIDLKKIHQQIFHSRMPTADEAVRIAQALNTTVEYLVTGKEAEIDKKKIAKEVLQNFINVL